MTSSSANANLASIDYTQRVNMKLRIKQGGRIFTSAPISANEEDKPMLKRKRSASSPVLCAYRPPKIVLKRRLRHHAAPVLSVESEAVDASPATLAPAIGVILPSINLPGDQTSLAEEEVEMEGSDDEDVVSTSEIAPGSMPLHRRRWAAEGGKARYDEGGMRHGGRAEMDEMAELCAAPTEPLEGLFGAYHVPQGLLMTV